MNHQANIFCAWYTYINICWYLSLYSPNPKSKNVYFFINFTNGSRGHIHDRHIIYSLSLHFKNYVRVNCCSSYPHKSAKKNSFLNSKFHTCICMAIQSGSKLFFFLILRGWKFDVVYFVHFFLHLIHFKLCNGHKTYRFWTLMHGINSLERHICLCFEH